MRGPEEIAPPTTTPTGAQQPPKGHGGDPQDLSRTQKVAASESQEAWQSSREQESPDKS